MVLRAVLDTAGLEAHATVVAQLGGGHLGAMTNFRGTSFLFSDSAADLQAQVDKLMVVWNTQEAKMQEAYNTSHQIKTQMDTNYATNQKNLENSCLELRNIMDKITEDRKLCTDAQDDGSSGLPALFMKRAKDPKRFARFQRGKIYGCAPLEGKEGDMSPADVSCTCPTGSEEHGCGDATDPAKHRLFCTKVLDQTLIEMGLADMFKVGGTCVIENSVDFAQPLIDTSAIATPVESSAGTLGLVAMAAPRVVTLGHQPDSSCQCGCCRSFGRNCHTSRRGASGGLATSSQPRRRRNQEELLSFWNCSAATPAA